MSAVPLGYLGLSFGELYLYLIMVLLSIVSLWPKINIDEIVWG
jgi:hypothetical protein